MAGGEIVDSMNRAVDGIVAARERRERDANIEKWSEYAEGMKKERDDALIVNAANYAEKHALRAALAKLDPTHPLLTNKALQEKIQGSGERIWILSKFDNESVAKAGRDYQY